jgi:hypothetical protein
MKEIQHYLFNAIKHKHNHHDEYKNIFNYFSSIKIFPIQNKSKQSQISSYSRNIQSQFMSKNISQSIQSFNYQSQTKFQINHCLVSVNIYSETDNDKFSEEIIPVIHYMVCLFPNNQKNTITVNYYLSDEKKEFPEDSSFLGVDNVNSGYCSNGSTECEITIYRKEEIVKVTIHELIHGLHNVPLSDTEDIIQFYQNRYNISSQNVKIDEAYTEIWANIINCFILSLEFKGNEYGTFIQILAMEQLFCQIQASRIMNHTNMNHQIIDINKHTNVLAYYIIRCEIFQNLSGFLKYCREKNRNYIQINNENDWHIFFKQQNNIAKHSISEPPVFNNTLRMSAINNHII